MLHNLQKFEKVPSVQETKHTCIANAFISVDLRYVYFQTKFIRYFQLDYIIFISAVK